MSPAAQLQHNAHSVVPRPFLKWAGGKRQLLPHLRRFVPDEFNDYYEPFLGSGAMFFDLASAGAFALNQARLLDTNADLIGCYRAIAHGVDEVIDHLRELEQGHHAAPQAHYYKVRDGLYNPARRVQKNADAYRPQLAAMLIYLNRTGFNGLYRLNASGDFNVPIGRYSNPLICDADNLRAVSQTLRSSTIRLIHGSYDLVRSHARSGDLLYFDPPYAPLSLTASFTSYTAVGFTENDQRDLQQLMIELAERGCAVILSNSTAPLITSLYKQSASAKRAGLRAYEVPAKRAINSKATRRGDVLEYIVSNVSPRD